MCVCRVYPLPHQYNALCDVRQPPTAAPTVACQARFWKVCEDGDDLCAVKVTRKGRKRIRTCIVKPTPTLSPSKAPTAPLSDDERCRNIKKMPACRSEQSTGGEALCEWKRVGRKMRCRLKPKTASPTTARPTPAAAVRCFILWVEYVRLHSVPTRYAPHVYYNTFAGNVCARLHARAPFQPPVPNQSQR